MSKPYYVLEVVEGKPGKPYKLWERPDFASAVELAVEFAREQTDTPVDDIRKEIEADTDFLSADGTMQVCILQSEDE